MTHIEDPIGIVMRKKCAEQSEENDRIELLTSQNPDYEDVRAG